MLRLATATLLLVAGPLACATPAPDPGALAVRHADEGRLDEARAEIEKAVRQHPDDARLRRQAASIHARAGDLGSGIAHLESGIRVAPEDAELWIDLGELERRRDNIADAYVAYRRASELAPADIRAVSGLALAADTLGFEEEAAAAYERWTELERLHRE